MALQPYLQPPPAIYKPLDQEFWDEYDVDKIGTDLQPDGQELLWKCDPPNLAHMVVPLFGYDIANRFLR